MGLDTKHLFEVRRLPQNHFFLFRNFSKITQHCLFCPFFLFLSVLHSFKVPVLSYLWYKKPSLWKFRSIYFIIFKFVFGVDGSIGMWKKKLKHCVLETKNKVGVVFCRAGRLNQGAILGRMVFYRKFSALKPWNHLNRHQSCNCANQFSKTVKMLSSFLSFLPSILHQRSFNLNLYCNMVKMIVLPSISILALATVALGSARKYLLLVI